MTTTESSIACGIRFTRSLCWRRSRLEQDLDRAVLLLLEDLVAVWRLVERQHVGGEALDAERVIVAGEGAA